MIAMRPALAIYLLVAGTISVLNLHHLEYDPETFWTMMSVWATGLVGFIAFHQISEARRSNEDILKQAREENMRERTLAACMLFDHDPVVFQIRKTLFEARRDGTLEKRPSKYREELLTILNYLDVIAIGIERNVYDEGIARHHMEGIMRVYVERYFHDRFFPEYGPLDGDYVTLRKLMRKWDQSPEAIAG